MSSSIFSGKISETFGQIGGKGLADILAREGRFPSLTLQIKPLKLAQGDIKNATKVPGLTIERFTKYNFNSSILIPVDTFSFDFVAPDGPPLPEQMMDGDIAVISANQVTLATGVIDIAEVETSADGENGQVQGRDLMGMMEDQDAISIDSNTIWGNDIKIPNAIRQLLADTRITEILTRDVPNSSALFSTEPGQSKIAALQTLLEPYSCLAWMSPDGKIIIGKPNMSQKAKGALILSKEKRISNVLSMRVTRASTQIPNVVVPVWVGQETTLTRTKVSQQLRNAADGPARLFSYGHRIPKSVVVSTPRGADAQSLAALNQFEVAIANAAGGGSLLNAYAKREIARQNVKEMIVEVVVPGHFNELGEPFLTDTKYYIEYDRGKVYEDMYLYECQYTLTPDGGQKTNLFFCRLGSIVADLRAP